MAGSTVLRVSRTPGVSGAAPVVVIPQTADVDGAPSRLDARRRDCPRGRGLGQRCDRRRAYVDELDGFSTSGEPVRPLVSAVKRLAQRRERRFVERQPRLDGELEALARIARVRFEDDPHVAAGDALRAHPQPHVVLGIGK